MSGFVIYRAWQLNGRENTFECCNYTPALTAKSKDVIRYYSPIFAVTFTGSVKSLLNAAASSTVISPR